MSEAQTSIVILGASGRTGKLVMQEALRRNIAVVALVRKASSLEARPNLSVVEGTPLELQDMQRAFKAAQSPISAVVSTLGQTRKSGSPWAAPTSPPLFMAEAIKNAIAVAKQTNPSVKLVVMSLFGVGQSFKNNNFLMRCVFDHSQMAQTIEDGNAVDKLVKESGLNFVLVRSAMLMGSTVTPVRELGDEGEKAGFMPSISPNTVSGFLLNAVESNQWERRTPVISS